MTDVVTARVRSRMMAGIGRKDTAPELAVRSYLHRTGLRFRVNDRRLPGSPDIVFARHRVAVFVHGCFWHRHPACRYATTPLTRTGFWTSKFDANVERDGRVIRDLEAKGWTSVIIWGCETGSETHLDELAWKIIAAGE